MNLGGEHLGPWEMAGKEEREPIAAFCDGEGHAFADDDPEFWTVIEPCRDCAGGPVRNHRRWRVLKAVES